MWTGVLLVAVGLLSLVNGSPALDFKDLEVAGNSLLPADSMSAKFNNGISRVKRQIKFRSRVKRQAVEMTQPLRILPFYADDFDTNLQEKASFVRDDIIPNVIDFARSSLRVAPLSEPIRVTQNCNPADRLRIPTDGRYICLNQCQPVTMCGTSTVPTEHLRGCLQCNAESFATLNVSTCVQASMDGPGVTDYDLVLYITANQSACPGDRETSQTIAFASSCEKEFRQDRPIAGFVNFCPVGLRNAGRGTAFTVTKHEVVHVLGFTRALFSFWRDPTNNMPRTSRNEANEPSVLPDGNLNVSSSTLETVTYENWITAAGSISHNVTRLITPAIRREARSHFNCSSLSGVELENQGGPQAVLGHFEKRVLGNEAMTALISFNPVFSRFTFAALEDSGWYNVNYSNAEELIWGRNAGCRFVEGSCLERIQTQTSNNQLLSPFCNLENLGMNSCSVDREAISRCDNFSYTSIPPEFQYFSDPQLGGFITVADFCPIQEGNIPCFNRSLLPNNNSLLEDYGPGSRCINHGRAWTVDGQSQQMSEGSGCYQYSCGENTVTIKIASQDIVCACSQAEQEMMVDLMVNNQRHQGSILCPPCTQICHTPSRNIPRIDGGDATTQPGDVTTTLSASESIHGSLITVFVLSLSIVIKLYY